MKLSDLFLNRFLYRDNNQNLETKGADFQSMDSSDVEPNAIPAGGAAQDINTGNTLIDGAQLEPGTYPVTTLDVSNWGWGQTCAFTSADLDTVTWGAGVFTSASGESYSIDAGTTGNMAAKTYIYLDLLVSETAYQITTTPATAVGLGKVLIAVAENAAVSATYMLSEATQIVGDNIIANSINASKITAGQLIVGTNVGLGTAQDATQVTTIVGNVVTTGFVNALSVTAGSVSASNVTAGTMVGSTIKTSNDTNRIEMKNDNTIIFYDGSGYVRTTVANGLIGFRDASNNVAGGIYGSGDGEVTVACDGLYRFDGDAFFPGYSGQDIGKTGSRFDRAYFDGNIYTNGDISASNFSGSSSGTNTGDSSGHTALAVKTNLGDYSYDGTYLKLASTGLTVKGSNGLYVSAVNYMDFKDWRLTLTSNKTAILPTSKGFNSLYCIESPEVWFMDFCDESKKLAPMFEEVTVSPYHYIKCESGGYQVWGKRKGHEKYRFESKTQEEFIANEKFLNMNKPI